MSIDPKDPHRGAEVFTGGAPVATAEAAVVMFHGRGGSATDMLGLARDLARELPAEVAAEVAWLAPQASGHTWYPQRFLAPFADNEPALSSALALGGRVLANLTDGVGLPTERVVLLGFSQGACLALELAARHPRRWGGVVGLTGGLIGPPGTVFAHAGALDGTPVFLGGGDDDPHVPLWRIEETAAAFTRMGAAVTHRVYPGLPHVIDPDELVWVRRLLAKVVPTAH